MFVHKVVALQEAFSQWQLKLQQQQTELDVKAAGVQADKHAWEAGRVGRIQAEAAWKQQETEYTVSVHSCQHLT